MQRDDDAIMMHPSNEGRRRVCSGWAGRVLTRKFQARPNQDAKEQSPGSPGLCDVAACRLQLNLNWSLVPYCV